MKPQMKRDIVTSVLVGIGAFVIMMAIALASPPLHAWEVHSEIDHKTDAKSYHVRSSAAKVVGGNSRGDYSIVYWQPCNVDSIAILSTARIDFEGDSDFQAGGYNTKGKAWYRVDGGAAVDIPAFQLKEHPSFVGLGRFGPHGGAYRNQLLSQIKKGLELRIGLPISGESDLVLDIDLVGASTAIARVDSYCN